MTVTLPLPFRSSRTLVAGNGLLGDAGVALDLVGIDLDEDLYDGWRSRVEMAARHLGWPPPRLARSMLADCSALGFTAPAHQLHTACATNEWALCAAMLARDPCHWGSLTDSLREAAAARPATQPGVPAEVDEEAALMRLAR
ncbi:MAG: hypothetical protein ACR2I8_06255, partial [Steroidobacteraceae bacterium]